MRGAANGLEGPDPSTAAGDGASGLMNAGPGGSDSIGLPSIAGCVRHCRFTAAATFVRCGRRNCPPGQILMPTWALNERWGDRCGHADAGTGPAVMKLDSSRAHALSRVAHKSLAMHHAFRLRLQAAAAAAAAAGPGAAAGDTAAAVVQRQPALTPAD
ncbi:hypothetical protein Vretimale_12174, partial [Volvox reticuliferus]